MFSAIKLDAARPSATRRKRANAGPRQPVGTMNHIQR